MKQIPKFFNTPSMQVITARPEGMTYEKYREERKRNTRMLRYRLKGVMVWKSSAAGAPIGKSGPWGKFETWGTLVGQAPSIRIVGGGIKQIV